MRRFAVSSAAAALVLALIGYDGLAAADPATPPAKPIGPLSAAAKAAITAAVPTKPIQHVTTHRRIPPLAPLLTMTVAPGTRTSIVKPGSAIAREIGSIKTCEELDPSIPPAIARLKGKITSNGYIVIDGSCFGTQGTVELVGIFPTGGRLTLQNQAWSPTSITTAIPPVSNVFPQNVLIRVIRGNVVSNEVTAAFTPEWEQRIAPAQRIVNSHCDFDNADCKDGAAHHYYQTDGEDHHTGMDQWVLQPPPGWWVDYLEITTYAGTAIVDDFASYAGTQSVLVVHWEDRLQSISTTTLRTLFGSPVKSYAAVYTLTAHLVGPLGSWH